VREALIQLAAEGLVELRPRRGAVVAQATPQRLVEMFEVMAELEAMCARLAARRLHDADLVALEAALACCDAAAAQRDPDAYFYANEEFHRALYTASHNDFLVGQTLALQRQLRPYRRLQLRVRHRMQHSLTEHAEILAALRQGDAVQAMEATRRHVVVQGERFADLLASLQQLAAA
jgi:DNA-binding GntR family transcriptional regulator